MGVSTSTNPISSITLRISRMILWRSARLWCGFGRRRSRYRKRKRVASAALISSSIGNGGVLALLRMCSFAATSSTSPLANSGLAFWRLMTFPSTATTNSLRACSAFACAAGCVSLLNTTCTIPVRSRTSRNSKLPRSRRRATHPMTIASDDGSDAIVMGWVARRRDLGNLLFLDVRDRTGIVQVVFNKETQPAAHAKAEQARSEFVVAVEGKVIKRQKANPELASGEVELVAAKLHILNNAKTPPFPIEDEINAAEETRLRFRYLDLRRPKPHRNLALRHKIIFEMRKVMDEMGFIEVETPMLTRSTPEGARDFLVPSRVHHGQFYALPQSPQIFKQILMIAGLDKYFQIVKCFRDEDQRADRQLEFTQLDL